MSLRNDPTEIENCTCVGEVAKAIRVTNHDTGTTEWFPRSLIEHDSDIRKTGDKGSLIVPRWIAEDRGWI
jgi:hypothetical protein